METAARIARVLTPAVLALALFAAAWSTWSFAVEARDAVVLFGLYASLALALHAGALTLARVVLPLGLLGSLALGGILAWHLREQQVFGWLSGPELAAVALGVALLHFPLLWLERRRAGASSSARVCAAAALAFAVLLVGAFELSNTLRWQVLRQNRLIGTPAYYLLSRPVPEAREELWDQPPRRSPPSRPAMGPPPPESASRPHIVFIMVDTLRADALAAYGADPASMPRLDAFAAGQTVFRDVLSNASWTRPSVASFFTGLLPEEHGAVNRTDRLPSERWALAEILREGGYETVAFVSNYGAVGRDAGFDQGFRHFVELPGGVFPYARADSVNAAVASWLRRFQKLEAGRGRPLFLYIHYLDPHTPYLAGDPLRRYHPNDARRAYRDELGYLDGELASLIGLLERELAGPRVLLLTSDHGEEFGEHGEGGHGHSLYWEVARIPVVLAQPGGGPARIDARLEARDFFDLLLRLAADPRLDVKRWAATRSRSRRYLSTYSTSPAAPHRPYRRNVALRGVEEDGFFLIWSAYGPTWELYDRAADPGEKRNVAREHPERVQVLAESLEESVGWWSPRKQVRESEKTLELLRQLGYVE